METEVIFNDIIQRIQLEINRAKKSIHVATAWFTNQDLFDLLVEKAQQGITVQLIISNDDINKKSHLEYNQLNIGLSLAYLTSENKQYLIDNNFFIIDEETIINGFYHWNYDTKRRNENILVIKGDSILVELLNKQFNKVLETSFKYRRVKPEIPYNKIIKILERIRGYIVLEDTDSIRGEIATLEIHNFQQNISAITYALQQSNYDKAVSLINRFINIHRTSSTYHNTELKELRIQVRQLEHKLNAFNHKKTEFEHLISDFYDEHTKQLGSYIKRLLFLRKLFTIYDPRIYAQIEQTERDYYECIKDEAKRNLYELDQNKCKDLTLSISKPQRSPIRNEMNHLSFKILRLDLKIHNAEQELFEIKESDDYQSISSIDNWNSYFEETKAQLIEEIKFLEENLSFKN